MASALLKSLVGFYKRWAVIVKDQGFWLLILAWMRSAKIRFSHSLCVMNEGMVVIVCGNLCSGVSQWVVVGHQNQSGACWKVKTEKVTFIFIES
jgi:hypothetical protein